MQPADWPADVPLVHVCIHFHYFGSAIGEMVSWPIQQILSAGTWQPAPRNLSIHAGDAFPTHKTVKNHPYSSIQSLRLSAPLAKNSIVAFLCVLLFTGAFAEDGPAAAQRRELFDLSLEELMNESVTSVSKKETKLSQSPAAIFVIKPEDIRRTGATSIPEALRMVPGLNVARINANEWAVSSRGFNNQYANKLLVLVDGRSVYVPTFSGVNWNSQDLMLEDLDRIEVIRGPGATLWGANAVNGVINIMTKSARDTQGTFVSTAYGTDLQPLSNVRYGGQLGSNLFYRAYGQFLNHDNFSREGGGSARDEWQSGRTGMRLDWHPTALDQLTLQGDYSRAAIGQTFETPQLTPVPRNVERHDENQNYGANVLARWTRTLSPESSFSLQTYYERQLHVDAEAKEYQETFDIDWQHRFALGQRNSVIWGVGYRYMPDYLKSSDKIIFNPERAHDQLFSGFLQDEFKLVPDKLLLTAGSKFEHNDYTGFEIQPSGRLMWTPTDKQSIWGSASRAVRTPSRFETAGRAHAVAFQPPGSPPVQISVLPDAKSKSEELTAYELGYRIEPHKRLAFDIAGFYNVYDNNHSYAPGTPRFEGAPTPHVLVPVEGGNNLHGDTYGVELYSQWHATDRWRLSAGYTWLHMRTQPSDNVEKDNPQHQVNVKSYLDLTKDLELNVAAYFVDRTSHASFQSSASTPAYLRLDVGLTWRPTSSLELAVWGQNLLDSGHTEFSSYQNSFLTEIPRGVYGKITWRF